MILYQNSINSVNYHVYVKIIIFIITKVKIKDKSYVWYVDIN